MGDADMARHNSWLSLSMDAWSLGFEASTVMALRTLRLATGGADAQLEAQRMVTEKIDAAFDLQARAMTGRLGSSVEEATAKTVSHYRRAVRANHRRLTRG
jgi:hypothetical protein